MSKLFSKKSKVILGVVAVIYVLFTAYYVYSLVKWGGKRRIEEVEKNYVQTGTTVYTAEKITLPERIVPEGTVVDEHLITELRSAGAADSQVAAELDKGIKIRGSGSPIGMNATAIYQGLNFLVLVSLLGAVAWKPTLEMLDQRAETIRSDLETAAQDREDADRLKSQYEGMLDEGRRRRSELIASGEEAGKTEAERLRKKAEQEADRIRDKAAEEADAVENQTRQKLVGEFENLSRELAAQVLRREVTLDDHRKMVDEFVAEVKKAPKA